MSGHPIAEVASALSRSEGDVQPLGGYAKRAFDVAVSLLALILLSPLMLFVALLIKMTDGGPAIFSHGRIGFNGAEFGCLKFRSMAVNSAEILAELLERDPEARLEWNATQKLRHDPRITLIGRVIRTTSIDELPQLVNVLRGEMSLVGPRPIVAAEVARYEGAFQHYVVARPGITGLWQVSGRSETSYEERVRFDSLYARGWSFATDLRILFRTVVVVLAQRGSY